VKKGTPVPLHSSNLRHRLVRNRISRRTALRSLGATSLGLLASSARVPGHLPEPAAAYTLPQQETPARPNIVLILLDDLRFDDVAVMPAVQSLLMAEGTSFSNFFAASPGCAPARATILRGQYPHNHGVLRGSGELGGLEQFYELQREESTIATWLHDAGYRTALIGKYLNGYGASESPTEYPPGWDEWAGVTREGYLRFELNQNGKLVRYRSGHGEQYSTDVFSQLANRFVAQTAASGTPFFLHLSPRAPHGPAEPAARHLMSFADATVPRSPSFNEDDVADKPNWVQMLPHMDDRQAAELDGYHRARLQTLLAVDELVASLVETLESTGTLDNTYIMFTSDNGYQLGEHRIVREKGAPYEESIHLPLVVRGPGVSEGETIAALVSQADLAPTFVTWAGAAIPDFVDGRSLAPLLSGDAAPPSWRQAVLVQQQANRPDRSTKQPAFQALRTAEFIYVESATGERELYDLANDPHQLENQASRNDPTRLEPLAAQLAAMRTCLGATCRAVEEIPPPDAAAVFSPIAKA
jgi:N-acetylglucosamine-6-sulfatase